MCVYYSSEEKQWEIHTFVDLSSKAKNDDEDKS